MSFLKFPGGHVVMKTQTNEKKYNKSNKQRVTLSKQKTKTKQKQKQTNKNKPHKKTN